jgi:hypothetical protein
MDVFLYRVAVEQLHGAKYTHELEVLVRKWHKTLSELSLYNSSTDYMKFKFTYKLFILSLKVFANKSKKVLPDFIYNLQTSYQREILSNLHTSETHSKFTPLLEYVEFLDFFEFDKVVETPTRTYNHLEVLHNIFLDKPIHFTFKFNQSLDLFDSYVAYDLHQLNKKLIYAIRLKQTLSPNTPSTVLDAYMEFILASNTPYQDASEHIIKLQQHIDAMKYYQSTYGALANGQSF